MLPTHEEKPTLLLSTNCNMLTHTFMLTDGCQVIWISCPVKITIFTHIKTNYILSSSQSHLIISSNLISLTWERKRERALATLLYFQNVVVMRGQWGHVSSGTICVCVHVCENLDLPVNEYVAREQDTHRKQEDFRPWPEYAGEGKVVTIRLTPR